MREKKLLRSAEDLIVMEHCVLVIDANGRIFESDPDNYNWYKDAEFSIRQIYPPIKISINEIVESILGEDPHPEEYNTVYGVVARTLELAGVEHR